jgi:hypothetical protein
MWNQDNSVQKKLNKTMKCKTENKKLIKKIKKKTELTQVNWIWYIINPTCATPDFRDTNT